jgi:hypothetical protein
MEGVMLPPLEGAEPVCVEPVLLVLPELFTGSETLCALGLVPPLPLLALCLLEGVSVGVVEGEGARGGEAHVEILVADLVYPRVCVVDDVDALEFEEEDFCEADVVECVRDLDLVLEGLRGGVGGGRGEGASAFFGGLSCEGHGRDVAGSATALHLRGRGTAEGCSEHGRGGERTDALIVK